MVQTRSRKKVESDIDSDCGELGYISGDISDYKSVGSSCNTKQQSSTLSQERPDNIASNFILRRSSRLSDHKKYENNSVENNPEKNNIKKIKKRTIKESTISYKPYKSYKKLKKINSESPVESEKEGSESEYEPDTSSNSSDCMTESESDESSESETPKVSSNKIYSNLIDSIVDNLIEDSSASSKKLHSQNTKWKNNLTDSEIEKFKNQYVSINDAINKIPTVKTLLESDMPFQVKCDLMEKLRILENTQPDTHDYVQLKTSMNDEIIKYNRAKIDTTIYEKCDDIERKINSTTLSSLPLKYRILNADISFNNKVTIYNKFKELETMPDKNGEYQKLSTWIEYAMSLPYTINKLPINETTENKKINEFLMAVRHRLDEKIYGLSKAKEQILFTLNNMISNPNSRGSGMAFVGPQGVGKTELAQSLAEAVNLPFNTILLGGANDGSILTGHNYTYEGSIPGAIVSTLIKMKQLNGIIFFDELDKISDTPSGADISKSLLHITDSTQNHSFKDRYLGNDIIINLSNIWFIYSLNYIELLDKTLRDRIPIINIEGYTRVEKKEISKLHLIPKELKNIKLNAGDIIFSDESLDYLISMSDELYSSETKSSTGRSGIRQLKHIIINVIMKLNMIKNCTLEDGTCGDLKLSYHIKNFKLPFTVNKSHIDELDVLPKKDNNSAHLSMFL